MTENALQWPSDLGYATLVGRFGFMDADGPDADREPDIKPATSGTVTIEPSISTVRYDGTDGPMLLVKRRVEGVIDDAGYLSTKNQDGTPGPRGIVIPATDADLNPTDFTYQIRISLTNTGTISTYHIKAPTGATVDLAKATPVEQSGGTATIVDYESAIRAETARDQAEAARDQAVPAASTAVTARNETLTARDQTLAARDETLAHGITVDTSVGTRVFVGDTMIHGETGWRELPLPERFISGRVLIKREKNDVTLRLEGVEITGLESIATTDYLTATNFIPNGFRPPLWGDRPVTFFIGDYAQYRGLLSIAQQSRLLYLASAADDNLGTGNARASGEMTWTTTPVWPTQLPGTPS